MTAIGFNTRVNKQDCVHTIEQRICLLSNSFQYKLLPDKRCDDLKVYVAYDFPRSRGGYNGPSRVAVVDIMILRGWAFLVITYNVKHMWVQFIVGHP